MEGIEKARLCARFADDKKAEDIVVMNLAGISPITDFFVICTASSSPHLRAVRDGVEDGMREEHHIKPLISDGDLESQWLILHYGDVMVHVLQAEKREYYSLEDLWGEAKRVEWGTETKPAAKSATKPAAKKKA